MWSRTLVYATCPSSTYARYRPPLLSHVAPFLRPVDIFVLGRRTGEALLAIRRGGTRKSKWRKFLRERWPCIRMLHAYRGSLNVLVKRARLDIE